MLQFGPKDDVISKKKGIHRNFNGFSGRNSRWSQKKKVFGLHMLISQCHFDGPPLKPMGPLLGHLKQTAPWWSPWSPWAPGSLSPLPRGAESRTWAHGQLKCDGFPVLWTSRQTEKMPQFCPNYDVISKKKVFTEILTVFPIEIKWSPTKKKRSSGLKCWLLSVISMGLSRAHGPSAGLAEANGFPEAHGAP